MSSESDYAHEYAIDLEENEDEQEIENRLEVDGSDEEEEDDELEDDVEIDVDESEYIDECSVNVSHFDFIKRLGSGAYGTVFLVKKNCGIDVNKIYALKVIAKEVVVANPKTIIHMKAERSSLELLRGCPYIPKLYYAFQTDEKLFLVIDYIPGGEMFTLLQKCAMDEPKVRFYIAELIVALEHIHKQGIVYRDIKLENILIDADGHIKLVDFGLCKKLGRRGRSKSFCGTVEYMAPEIVSNQGHNTAADWWALGVLTIELLTTITPFGTNDTPEGNEIMQRITNSDPIMPSNISPEMEDFIHKMLVKNPEERLGGSEFLATEIKQHPLFNDIDWDKLEKKQILAPEPPNIDHPFDTQNFSSDFTDLDATYPPSEVPQDTFLTFKGYSYIAPELNETLSNSAKYPNDEDGISLSWEIYSNREPDSEFDRKYRFASTQPIGKGRSSICMKCINLNNNNCYAVKIYKRQDENKHQIDVLKKAACKKLPNILHLVEVLRDSKWTYLIMELIVGDNLLAYLSRESITGRDVYDFFVALCTIVKAVHSLKYAHRRICFKNIYHVEHSKDWRIIGFSNAQPLLAKHDEYVDYWSIGVCLYTIVCGHAPFVLNCEWETINDIKQNEFNQDSFKWRALKKPTKILIDQLLCSQTPTLNPKDLKCIVSEFDSVSNSKQQLDDNEHIISMLAVKIRTLPVVENNLRKVFNGIDINGINSSESPQTTSDTPQINHADVQVSQIKQVNGHARRGRPKKTPIIKAELIPEDDKLPEMTAISPSDSLDRPQQIQINVKNIDRRLRNKTNKAKPDIINIKEEIISAPLKNNRPKKTTKQPTDTANQQTENVASTSAPANEIKKSSRIALLKKRKQDQSHSKNEPENGVKPAKRVKKEMPRKKETHVKTETTTETAISAPSTRREHSDIGVQTFVSVATYRPTKPEVRNYIFLRFDYNK